ncbi:hypothetical protein BIZ41_10660 [Escherichia coli]|nr:hypothetical protein BIZ41_10660 [Escherichia coli]
MGSCAAPSVKGDDKFITTDYLQQCQSLHVNRLTNCASASASLSSSSKDNVLIPCPITHLVSL